ncbi:MAG TPA: DUF86 domain-containing protein [Thermodesulfovibrionales bacterium]|jgi:uncharacterized protein with HEPN domain|nr:DUF86 domain-containing protein [Thermodesulfovibrionales bacterium]
MRNISLYLQDILDAMHAIEKFVEGIDFEEFKADDKTASAVIRKFEIIGEAAKQVPEDIRKKYNQLPWKEMAGMRDRLIHFYFDVKHELVWQTIRDVIPTVKPLIQEILRNKNSV